MKLPSETSVVIATTSIQMARASGTCSPQRASAKRRIGIPKEHTLQVKQAAQPVFDVVGMKLAKSSAKSNS